MNSLISSHVFFIVSLGFFSILYHVTCREWQFYFSNLDFFYLFFFFSDCCVCLWLSTLSWIKVERDSFLILFLILEEMLSAFHCWLWCWLWVCHIWPLLCWGVFPLYPLCWEAFFFLIINVCLILSKSYSASVEMVIWFLFFSLLIQCITLSVLWILCHLHIPGINSIW